MKLQYHVKQSFDLLKDIDDNKCICTYLHKMHNFFFMTQKYLVTSVKEKWIERFFSVGPSDF